MTRWTAPDNYSEYGVEHGADIGEFNPDYKDLWTLRDAIDACRVEELCPWLEAHRNELDERTTFLFAQDAKDLEPLKGTQPYLIFDKRGLSRVRHLNTLLNTFNDILSDGGYLWCHSRTSALKHQVICNSYPGIKGKVMYAFHYLWHRVFAKLTLTRWFYMMVTGGKNRSYSRVEILGRMCRAGFQIVDERFSHGEFYVLGRKAHEPRRDKARSYGMLIKLNRVGYKGKNMGVYKFRSMYPYSEYLQPYMMEHEGLCEGGKFNHDYRINFWGRKFRSGWIDELPMLINILKGEMKLVGVRPLSRHYYSLYTPEMQQLHISVKPGLLPPFYYEGKMPETIEEVQEGERRYIEAYKKAPFSTDWRYFWGIFSNIVFKRKRSH
ncbi:MAG: sugar transferase [Bacteroidales bacterium]|nr:sugar transferase [Bacteroidales bacterium]